MLNSTFEQALRLMARSLSSQRFTRETQLLHPAQTAQCVVLAAIDAAADPAPGLGFNAACPR